jgi:hypothetical protein
LKNVAGDIWMLEMTFDKYILYPGQSVFSGNVGIHLTDWQEFDKKLQGLVVVDENDEILWGTPWNGNGTFVQEEYVNAQN